MTARIAGFVTRAAAGLRGPDSFTRNITPAKGGVAIHYGGPRQPAAAPGASHSKCVSTWRAWQKYHMDTHGWADIAYTGGFCNHGFAFAGRGSGVRTAANGTNAGNQNYYAVTWIGGDGQKPTQAALDAADWWISELRQNGSAGPKVKPHRYFKSTGCPGDPLVGYAESRDGKAISKVAAPAPTPTPIPVVEKELGMYSLVREDGKDPVFAVRHGSWTHITGPQLYAIRKAGLALNDGEVVILTGEQINELYNLLTAE